MMRSDTPDRQSQTRMVLSSEAETRNSPSGVKATSLIRARWPPVSRSRWKSTVSSARSGTNPVAAKTTASSTTAAARSPICRRVEE
jgi:hypothetical protein